MTAKAGYSTPMLHVADVKRSIRFYQLLGFELVDDDAAPDGTMFWARVHCEGGALMFLRAEHGVETRHQAVLLYLYTPDLPVLRGHLIANRVEVSPIVYPDYMPSGEINIKDPDGYSIAVGHWSKTEHEKWEKRVEEKKKQRALEQKQ